MKLCCQWSGCRDGIRPEDGIVDGGQAAVTASVWKEALWGQAAVTTVALRVALLPVVRLQ